MENKSTKPNNSTKDISVELAKAAIFGIEEKKGRNIRALDLRNIKNAVCDFFIICEAESTTQVSAIADSVAAEVKKQTNHRPHHIEGMQNAEWVLVDYLDVVVHVFQPEVRRFYNLESLWADAAEFYTNNADKEEYSFVQKEVVEKPKPKAMVETPQTNEEPILVEQVKAIAPVISKTKTVKKVKAKTKAKAKTKTKAKTLVKPKKKAAVKVKTKPKAKKKATVSKAKTTKKTLTKTKAKSASKAKLKPKAKSVKVAKKASVKKKKPATKSNKKKK